MKKKLFIGYKPQQPQYFFTNLIINFTEYTIYKVHLMEYYKKQNFTASFIIREFKTELKAYCSFLKTKTNLKLDKEFCCIENFDVL